MHRPLIILVAFVLVGAALYLFQPGLSVDAEAPTEIAAAAPNATTEENFAIPPIPEFSSSDDIVTLTPSLQSEPVFSVAPVEEEDANLIASANSGLIADDVAEENTFQSTISASNIEVPAQPTFSVAPLTETVALAPAFVEDIVEDTVASSSIAAPQAPVLTEAETTLDLEVTRSRPVVEIEQPETANVVVTAAATQVIPAQTPQRPDVGSGSLLLTAMSMGDDGVLRPSLNAARFGSEAITATMPTEVQPSAATSTVVQINQPAPRPSVSVAPAAPQVQLVASNDTSDVLGFLSAGAVTATNEILTTHTVAAGDSLTKMAIQYYGTKDAFVHIYQANRDILSRPERISVGQRLRIPVVPAYQ